MTGALAEHRVQAQADEEGDEGKDYNGGQWSIPIQFNANIVPVTHGFKGCAIPICAIAPDWRDC